MDTKLVAQLNDTTKEIASVETEIMEATAHLQKRLSTLRQTDADVRAAIKEAMIKNNVKKYDSDNISITLVAATTRKSIDTKAMQEAHPKIAAKFMRETPVAASVRIKVK